MTFRPIHFQHMQFQPLPFQLLTVSTICIFNRAQFRPKLIWQLNLNSVKLLFQHNTYYRIKQP